MTQNHNKKVKVWATMLLVCMALLYIISRSFEHQHSLWHWVRAFAEAGMIGALADWFAVVALFRHPLNLPIPHTAIIQKQKDKIGVSLGRFVKKHFLTKELITKQLHQYAPMKRGVTWLTEESNASRISNFVAEQVPQLTEGESYQSGCKKVAPSLCQKLSTLPLEREIGKWMISSMHGADFRKMVSPIFGKLATGIERNKEWVGQEASQRAPVVGSKLLSKLTKGVTEAVSSHMVIQVAEQLKEASNNTTHTFYDKLEEALKELGEELMDETGTKGEWAQWRAQMFTSQTAIESCEMLLTHLGALVKDEQSQLQNGLTKGLIKIANNLKSDDESLQLREEQVINYLSQLSTQYADAFEQMIVDRIKDWNAESLTNQIEHSIGTDLQFIRINGSVIGGIIGIILYGVGLLIWGA